MTAASTASQRHANDGGDCCGSVPLINGLWRDAVFVGVSGGVFEDVSAGVSAGGSMGGSNAAKVGASSTSATTSVRCGSLAVLAAVCDKDAIASLSAKSRKSTGDRTGSARANFFSRSSSPLNGCCVASSSIAGALGACGAAGDSTAGATSRIDSAGTVSSPFAAMRNDHRIIDWLTHFGVLNAL